MADSPATISNAPPDWAKQSTDLLCPLCEYNLRGLTNARCPECGFAFTWREILDAKKNRPSFLFEYGKGKNFKSFWQTFWRTSFPRRFWFDLNPAQPVKPVRMFVYWIIVTGMLMTALYQPTVRGVWQSSWVNLNIRWRAGLHYPTTMTPAEIETYWPIPTELEFWRQALLPGGRFLTYTRVNDSADGWSVIFICWPWLTLISMLVFRLSMRRAKIRTIHMARTVIYSCDFGLLFLLGFMMAFVANLHLAQGWIMLAGALLCGLITTYRLTIAFSRYLRVHQPLATVLASQVISLLVVFVVLVPIADFSRRV